MPLRTVADTLASAPDLGAALRGALGALGRAVSPDAAAVLARAPGGELRIAAQQGLRPAAERRVFLPQEHPRLLRALGAAGPLRFLDPGEPDPYSDLLIGAASQIHACMAVPLRIGGELLGVLTLDALDPRGLDRLRDGDAQVFGALCGAALRHFGPPAPPPEGPAEEPDALLGRGPAMEALRREIALLAPLPMPVLIEGETGVGKELVARALHRGSLRAAAPLLVLNSAAMPAELAAAELFGHVRGAFTSAAARQGRLAAADGGTLFLDEIGELPLPLQAQLLRAVQEGEVQRLGEDRPRHVDVRLLFATNRDLRAEVAAGRFRQDLYHRIAVYPLRVPPLRERREDIAELARHFAARFAQGLGREAQLSPGLFAALERYPFPGNVRELRNIVERALLRCLARRSAGPLSPLEEDLGLQPPGAAPAGAATEAGGLREALERARGEAFAAAFARAGGNAAEAARQLGLSRSFAYKEAVRLGLLPRPRR